MGMGVPASSRERSQNASAKESERRVTFLPRHVSVQEHLHHLAGAERNPTREHAFIDPDSTSCIALGPIAERPEVISGLTKSLFATSKTAKVTLCQ